MFPFRTQKLSPPAPMVVPPTGGVRVGHCRFIKKQPENSGCFLFVLFDPSPRKDTNRVGEGFDFTTLKNYDERGRVA